MPLTLANRLSIACVDISARDFLRGVMGYSLRKQPQVSDRSRADATCVVFDCRSCVHPPIGCSMPESDCRAGLPVKLRRLMDRLFRSYLYEAPRTDFGAAAAGRREHRPAGHAA